MLVITINRDQPIVLVGQRMAESGDERLPVAMICVVENGVNAVDAPDQFARSVGSTIIDDQNI